MKAWLITWLGLLSTVVFANSLPTITAQPINQTAVQGGAATFVVSATGAINYQWLLNGSAIAGATNSTYGIPNVQPPNCGYYVVLVGNATGWVPGQMAYLAIDYTDGGLSPSAAGTVPLSNQGNTYFHGEADSQYFGFGPITNGTARVVAGPQLDEMQAYGRGTPVTNGYYGDASTVRTVPTVAPGQSVYYQVIITYTNSGMTVTQPSTVMSLVAGGGSVPVPSAYGFNFPAWPEWPEPSLDYTTPTNQLRVAGETLSVTNDYFAYTDFGIPTAYWRKDGDPIPGGTNFVQTWGDETGGGYESVLTLTNVQAVDAGIYDVVVLGNDWIVGPNTALSIQITNGWGVFRSPRWSCTNFVCDLLGAATGITTFRAQQI